MLALGQRAIEAAIAAGATYADVRLTHQLQEAMDGGGLGKGMKFKSLGEDAVLGMPFGGEQSGVNFGGGSGGGIVASPSQVGGIPVLELGIGVRALVQGYWGFAASSDWTDNDAVRLGREAAGQAKIDAHAGAPRLAELGTSPIVRNARWVQPGVDPFTVSIDEKLDFFQTMVELAAQVGRFTGASLGPGVMRFAREERVFASSEGASYSTVRYLCFPSGFLVGKAIDPERSGIDGFAGTAAWTWDQLPARGWEMWRDLNLDEFVPQLLDQIRQPTIRDPGSKSVDVGKYDVVFGGGAAAGLLYRTLGVATELDRAMGYEANTGGTSFLGPDPLQFLGAPVASPQVTVRANKTTPHAAATVPWDDEGIAGQDFPLIQDGILIDYQTTREQAHWLTPWYEKHGMTTQSRGCSTSAEAKDCPIQMNPNLVLQPSREETTVTVDDLIKDTARGIYFESAQIDLDQQVRNGLLTGVPGLPPREIRNGKLGQRVPNAGLLFSSLAVWRHVVALGGAKSAVTILAGETKGEPGQTSICNVTAVPFKVTDGTIIDGARRS